MPITFNSSGGFLAGTISSSDNNIFIQTSGSSGAINLGTQLQLTGSEVIEKDSTGKIRSKKRFNTDGSITQQKFDANEKITETKVKDPVKGREFIRSGSSTANQIEFKQNANGAFITVSGSVPGYNIIRTPEGDASQIRLIRQRTDFMYDGDSSLFTIGVDSGRKSWFVNDHSGGSAIVGTNAASSLLIASSSGDVFVQKDLIAQGKIFAQEFHTELISSSIVFQSGSTQFGNSGDDIHTFSGSIKLNGIDVITNSQTGSFLTTSPYSSGDISGSFLQLSQSVASSRALKTSISGSFTALSSSLTTRINTEVVANASTSSFVLNSQTSSFATSEYSSGDISGSFLQLSQSIGTSRALKTSISGSFTTLSSSLATRINTEVVANASTSSFVLNSQTGSFSTSEYSSGDISGSFLTLSQSINSSRALKSGISGSFKTLSASLSTRINTEVVANSSTSSFVLNSQTGSFSTSEYSSGDISGSFLALSQSVATSRALKTSISGSFTTLSSSLATRINTEVVANDSTSSFITDSQTGSFATSEYSSGDISGSFLQLSQSIDTSRALKTSISGSFTSLSSSLATRINTEVVANSSTSSFVLNSQTSSFATSEYSSGDISGSFLSLSSSIATSRALKSGISGSFLTLSSSIASTRTLKTSVSGSFTSLSSSLATRINTTVVANASTSSFVLNSQTSSFATSEYSSGDISGSFTTLSSSLASRTDTIEKTFAVTGSDVTFDELTLTDNINLANNKKVTFADDNQYVQGNTTQLILEADNQLLIKADDKVAVDTPAFGIGSGYVGEAPKTLTVEGDISASSNIYVADNGSIYNTTEGSRVRFKDDELKIMGNPLNIIPNITASGDISASGNIKAAQLQDTSLTATRVPYAGTDGVLTDSANMTFSGLKLTTLQLDVSRGFTANEQGHSSGDFRVESNNNEYMIFSDASTDTVGINNAAPPKTLTVGGDISASGHLDVATHANMLDAKHFAYYISSTGNGDTKYFLPQNSLSEQSTPQPFTKFFAPYDGVFKRVIFNARDNNPGDVEVFFHTGSANTSGTTAVQSITIGSTLDDTAYEANFSSSICKVNKGDFYMVAIQGTNEVQNYWHGTWTIEYDTST